MIQKSLSLALLLALGALSSTSFANESFQHDAKVTYSDQSESNLDGTFRLDYRYYFSPITEKQQPYLLSGYLGQTSNLGGIYSGIGNDFDQYDISGEYVFDSKWFMKGQYANIDNADTNFSSDSYGVTLGYYFNSSSSFYLEYARSSVDYNFGDENEINKLDSQQDNITLGVDSFIKFDWTKGLFLSGRYTFSDYSVDSEFSFADFYSSNSVSDNKSSFLAESDWYVTNSWSVGASYYYDFDDSEFDRWVLSTDYYLPITDTIAAVFTAEKELDSVIDGFSYSVGINGRF